MACRSSLALPSSTRRRISLMTLRRRLWNMLSLPGRQRAPPGTVESLDRRAPREPEYPLGPELEDRVTAPDQLILYRGRLWVDNER